MVSYNNSRGRIQKQAGKLKSRENKDSIYFTIHANWLLPNLQKTEKLKIDKL